MNAAVDGRQDSANVPTTRRSLLALEFPGLDTFDDPTQEWRRLFSELLGTFLLVLVGAGGAVVNAQSHGAISRSTAVAAPGLMVMAIILFMGAVSGAHLNPAVTLAFSLRRDFPWRRLPGYLLAQLAGATLACLFLWASPISGASMNPARSFGPDLALNRFDHLWVYWAGPAAGAMIAVGIAWVLRGPGGD